MSGANSSDRAALLARIRAALRSVSGEGDDSDLSTAFGQQPQSVVDALSARLTGRAGNGQPVADLFDTFPEEAGQRAGLAMLNGLAQGPLAIASQLAQVLGMSQNRAETIARNELIGSYRDAQMANYRANSDVVGQWMWSAAIASACIMCVEMDGTIHNMDEDLMDHVCGRCAPLPITRSWDDIFSKYGLDASGIPETSITESYGNGHDWFMSQDAATQASIMGPAKYEAWRSGDISLNDLVGVRDDGAWGNSLYERSLKEMGLDAQDYLPFRMPRETGLGPRGAEAVQGARAAIPEPELVRVDLGNGMYTYVDPYEPLAADINMAGRDTGWQNIDDVLAGLRGEATEAGALPEIPPEHITEVHAQQMNMVDEWAKLRDMTPEQYEAAVSQHIQDMLNGSDLSLRSSPDALADILNDGRFKSVFESGRSGVSAANSGLNVEEYKAIRAGYEAKVFGEGDHPIYGYLSDAGGDAQAAQGFGEARIFFNDDVRDRATFTFGDSLDSPVVPRPLNAPQWDAFSYVDRPLEPRFGITISPEQWATKFDPLNVQSITQFDNMPLAYVEAQIHGPLAVDDIARVEFDTAPSQALQDKLEQAGIEWSARGVSPST